VHEDIVVAQIANALRQYGRGTPSAADSERGIREWWLADLEPPPTPEQVAKALRLLEAEGSYIRRRLEDGSELWRPASTLE
jgi:hypothetical protein